MKEFLIIIICSIFTGWWTNKIAIKLLFKPYQKKWWLPIFSPGVIPKSKDKLFLECSELIEENLFTKNDLRDYLTRLMPELSFMEIISPKYLENLINKISIKDIIINNFQKFNNKELECIVKDVSKRYLFALELLGGFIGGILGCIMYILINV